MNRPVKIGNLHWLEGPLLVLKIGLDLPGDDALHLLPPLGLGLEVWVLCFLLEDAGVFSTTVHFVLVFSLFMIDNLNLIA
jgi:hypothetical protein